jgi:hypothetical protein
VAAFGSRTRARGRQVTPTPPRTFGSLRGSRCSPSCCSPWRLAFRGSSRPRRLS